MSIAALDAAEPVTAAREALDANASETWLVGGVVRDALLGRPLTDVDLAVRGDPEQTARALARAVRGPVFSLSDAFGAWRVLSRDRATTFDVSPLQGATIEEDLAKRDFSVNAIAVSLEGGEPIDPQGGRADLEARTLRVLGAESYAEDPLRPLRLIRFAAELGLEPDTTTEELTARAAPRLSEPSPERVFAELRRIVVSDRVLEALALAERLGILNAVLPELVDLEGLEQSRFHHLDVYHHTMEVLERLIEIERDPAAIFGAENAARVAEVLAEPLADDLTRGEALRFGALLHDIAKPETHGTRDGRPTFIDHDRRGEQLSRAILTRLRTSERLRAYVGALCRHHLALGFLIHEQPLAPEKLYRYLHTTQPVEVEVTVLSCADRMATRAAGQEPWIATHLALGAEVMGPALDWRAHGPPPVPLRGDELARELGIAPGPELGRLLAELEQAAYTGEVEGREEAVAFARHRLPNTPESPA